MGLSLFIESNECLDTYIAVFKQMQEAIQNRKDYSAGVLRFHPRELKAVLKTVKPNVGQDPLPRFLLSQDGCTRPPSWHVGNEPF